MGQKNNTKTELLCLRASISAISKLFLAMIINEFVFVY